jgi:hypothetical protein
MMKRITLFVAAFLMVTFCAKAQFVNNPKTADGYIVKWDCSNNAWATSNSFEVDEAFTFAIDVTGTPLEDWLKETPTNAGATRSLAFNKWTGFGGLNGDSHRLKQIQGNIYGATWCFTQLATDLDIAAATTIGAETFVWGQVFGFEYTADTPGASWWQWPAGTTEGAVVDGGVGGDGMFKTAPYTGTKTSSEFYSDDYGNEIFGNSYQLAGYAPACATIGTGIHSVNVDAPVVDREYFNLQGVRLNKEPESGLFIETSILSNGARVSTKTIKPLR